MAKVVLGSSRCCRRVFRLLQWRRCLSLSASLSEVSLRGGAYTSDFNAARLTFDPQDVTPTYRVMGADGVVSDPSQDPQLSEEVLLRMYRSMSTMVRMDKALYNAHRMGLISFYMVAQGEEGTHIGSAAALDGEDMVYGQYREAGVLLWRGFTLGQVTDQCFSNWRDSGKGRQMPVHYGSKELNYQFISSPLATQMPQAPGYAYGLKQSGSKNCVIVYFGDGAAQEGDSHASMNFAATLGCPVIFFCRNNAYAISTPVEDQYCGDGIVTRGRGYGMEAIRVDGNDVFAVYNATQHARRVAVSEHRPVLIEAMTYRMGSHSTSDDQTLYQPKDEIGEWKELSPVVRLRRYLEQEGQWDQDKEVELSAAIDSEVKEAIRQSRGELKPSPNEMFRDVYDAIPPSLEKQRQEMWEHLQRHKSTYSDLKKFQTGNSTS